MQRILVGLALVVLLIVGRFATAENAPLQEALATKTMGNPQAPVTLTEFASLTCPHCANFHQNYLPAIKKDFIDTGKVKLVFVDFPLDGLALAGSMLARCAGEKRYFGFIDVLFRSQLTWSQSPNPRQALMQVARLGGMSDADFETCVADQPLLTGIRKNADDGAKEHGITSTPRFLIDGKKVEMRSFEELHGLLQKAVGS